MAAQFGYAADQSWAPGNDNRLQMTYIAPAATVKCWNVRSDPVPTQRAYTIKGPQSLGTERHSNSGSR